MEDTLDSAKLPTLPMHTLNQLCDASIDVARQIDAMMRLLVKEQGWAKFEFEVKRGTLGVLQVTRSFKMVQS